MLSAYHHHSVSVCQVNDVSGTLAPPRRSLDDAVDIKCLTGIYLVQFTTLDMCLCLPLLLFRHPHVEVSFDNVVAVELTQTLLDDLRSARAERGRRRVSHSLCMCVASHRYDGLVGGMDGVGGGWYACGTRRRGWSHVGRCLSSSRVRGNTVTTPDHTTVHVRISG